MDKISCNICNSNRYTKLYDIKNNDTKETFNLVKCSNCRLVYINPQPSHEELSKYYFRDEYYSYGEVLKEDQGRLNFIEKIKRVFRRRIFLTYGVNNHSVFQKFKKILFYPFKRRFGGIPAFLKNGKILDIGCGDGLFISQLKSIGWRVCGIEIDQEAVKRAQSHGFEVYRGRFEDFDFKDECYDVVRLWHVLEHFKNPYFNLKKIYGILKPGGQVILGVPNMNSLYSKVFKQNWTGLDVPRHLYHFSPQTIKKILTQSGFSEIKISCNSVGTGLASLVYVMNKKIKNEAFVNLVFNNAVFRVVSIFVDALLDMFRVGGCLEVRAMKE
ncbi:MAG: class I SAM-dependent methyltransferase [Candidatus Omnitrophica bacterium]|nr:class I SAM-dependent methyltransferase [Candidatus Omnitrophota bacterium]